MAPGWQIALQRHQALLRAWRSRDGVDRFAEALRVPDEGWREVPAPAAAARREEIAAEQLRLLSEATTWMVAAEMVDLVSHASRSMPPEPILRTDLPAPKGFAFLEKPFVARDEVDGQEVRLNHRAVHWYVDEGDRVVVQSYSGREDGVFGADVEGMERVALSVGSPPLVVGFRYDWRFGEPTWDPDGASPQIDRFVKALWAISAQTIAKVETMSSRASRRDAVRHPLPDAGGVRVITLRQLRRPVPEDQSVAEVDWKHRWIVSGHWRNQYLPGSGTHRQQWIHPYVKGPEDKPLLVRDQVVYVRR